MVTSPGYLAAGRNAKGLSPRFRVLSKRCALPKEAFIPMNVFSRQSYFQNRILKGNEARNLGSSADSSELFIKNQTKNTM